jgi:VWFA-related protein
MLAAAGEHSADKVRLLLDQRASVNLAGRDGETALMIAADRYQWDTLKVLLDRGADANLVDAQGRTALIHAAASKESWLEGRQPTIGLIIAQTADPGHKDAHGVTALMLMAGAGSPALPLLLAKGVDVNVRDDQGNTALMYAARLFDRDEQRRAGWALLAKGADVNIRNQRGETALTLAARQPEHAGVDMLKKFGAEQTPAQEPATFHADVALVHIDAEVTDHEGRILGELTRDDFRVFDEGKEQQVTGFSADLEPLDLILLFDISGSMRAVVQKVADASHEGLAELRTGDRVSVMVFNSRSRVVSGFTEDLEAVRRTIQEEVAGYRFGGGTLIQAACDDAALRFLREKRTTRRRAVLIVTDNMGMRTRKDSTVIRDFWEADAILSGLIIRNDKYQAMHNVAMVMNPHLIALNAGMRGIATKTGGDALNAGDPGSAFREAMHRIRTRYSLYYAQPPGKAGTKRLVHVELTADAAKRYPKSQVRSRTGYIVPK